VSSRYDIVMVTDCRLPGGTSASVAEEITAQAAAGYRTGLLHVDSTLVRRERTFNPRLRHCLAEGMAELIFDEEEVETEVVVFRHPTVAGQADPESLPEIRSHHRLMIANQAPGTPDGGEVVHYDPMEVERHLNAWLGGEVVWAPIGPLVRENLARVAPQLPVTEDDWVNIIDVDAWRTHRQGSVHEIPVIGRHSRNHPLKWPATAEELLTVYPDHGAEVHVLGGADGPRELLHGELPDNWVVHEFGAMPPEQFLAGIDFYVYYHHPDLVEAFGRTILEALASGAPAILPPHFEELFGDTCTYAEIPDVPATIKALHEDPVAYQRLSDRGVAFVEENFGHQAHVRRIAAFAQPAAGAHPVASEPPARPSERTRVLFMSTNGAGVGHLMRLMSMARRAPDHVDPIFLTLSQGASVVEDAGYLVEYFASRPVSKAPSAPWHALLRERLAELIDRYDIRAMVFDGTWPYRGFMEAGDDHPQVQMIWSRRAMWKKGVTNEVLEEEADRFDLIIEPGEFAADLDVGATSKRRKEATQVGPITYLGVDELLPREEARAELGLDPDRPAALVNLGAGNINDVDSQLGVVVDRLAHEPQLQVCVTRSIIADKHADLPENVRPISVYPLARYLQAFDFAFAASGYNSYHELVLAAVPTAFVPNLDTATDDQPARSRFAERVGVGLDLPDPDRQSVDRAVRILLDDDRRARMHERGVARRLADGGGDAMAAILDAVDGPRNRRPAPTEALRRRLEIAERYRLQRAAAKDAEQAKEAARAGEDATANGATQAPPSSDDATANGATPAPPGGSEGDGPSTAPAEAGTARPPAPQPLAPATGESTSTTSATSSTPGPSAEPPTPSRPADDGSVAKELRRLARATRAKTTEVARDPRIRAAGRYPLLALPTPARAKIQRRLRTLEEPDRTARPLQARPVKRRPVKAKLPVPGGSLLSRKHEKGLVPVLFILPVEATGDEVATMVDAVARLQYTHRTFAPIFLTHHIDFRPLRRYAYLFEHLPGPSVWDRVATPRGFASARRARIEDIVAWYQPRVTMTLTPQQGEDILRSEPAAVIEGLLG
jgi:UDP:flavonoid glycosyltransferase YjiC (YdhE family)